MRRVAGAVAVTLAVAGCGAPTSQLAATDKVKVRKQTAAIESEADAFAADAQRSIDQAEAAVKEAERVIAEQTRQAELARQHDAAVARALAAAKARTRASRSARPSAAPAAGDGDIFDALARCESGMNPRANTGNGFYGAFQFTLSTWHSLGYGGNPVEYDYGTQKAAAQRLVARSGWGQFPACSRKIGAR